MWVLIDANLHTFTKWLLDIRHGQATTPHNLSTSITIPAGMSWNTKEDLIKSVYSLITNHPQVPSPQFVAERAILAAQNDDIHSINSTILNHLPGNEQTYFSADSYSIESLLSHENTNIPVEFLHTLNALGLPIAKLHLKVGCLIIILQNIDPKQGLYNGTCARIISMSNCVFEIWLLTGDHIGEIALIPQITLSPSLTGLDFVIKLNRQQFPIQLAFALTIKFLHATSSQHTKVLLLSDFVQKKTQNVVYNKILLNWHKAISGTKIHKENSISLQPTHRFCILQGISLSLLSVLVSLIFSWNNHIIKNSTRRVVYVIMLALCLSSAHLLAWL